MKETICFSLTQMKLKENPQMCLSSNYLATHKSQLLTEGESEGAVWPAPPEWSSERSTGHLSSYIPPIPSEILLCPKLLNP
jgi:hypothetical protein